MGISHIIEPASQTRIETFLGQYSLEDLVANVKRNNVWESKGRLKELEGEVERTYRACAALSTRGTKEITVNFNLPYARVNNWRHKDCVPQILTAHRRPLTPKTKEERLSFAYILGVYSKISSSTNKGKKSFEPNIADPKARKRALANGRVLLGEELTEKGKSLRFSDKRLVSVLNHCLYDDFTSYVQTDEERVTYLRGYFDASNITIQKDNGHSVRYRIARKNKKLFDICAKTLFELGVFPRLAVEEGVVYVGGYQNLKRMRALNIDSDTKNRAAVASFLMEPHEMSTDLKTYYAMRTIVKKLFDEEDGVKSWRALGHEHGFSQADTLKSWTADIVREYHPDFEYKFKKPLVVQRYEALIAHFGISNVFEEETFVEVGENILFNVDGNIYCMPPAVQKSYLDQVGATDFDEQDLVSIHSQLYQNVWQGNTLSIQMDLDEDGIMQSIKTNYPYTTTVELEIEGEQVHFSNRAIFTYFRTYGERIRPLKDDDLTCLSEQYRLRDTDEGDLIFKTNEGGVVNGIFLKRDPKGGNRWSMIVHHVGVPLGNDGNRHCDAFGIY
jgi:hypothetical protein